MSRIILAAALAILLGLAAWDTGQAVAVQVMLGLPNPAQARHQCATAVQAGGAETPAADRACAAYLTTYGSTP